MELEFMSIRKVLNNFLLILLLAGLITACKPNDLMVTNAWARPGSAQGNSAVFFSIENRSPEADSLIDAECDSAEKAEIHRSYLDAGVVKMEFQENLEIPPNSSLQFEPGSYHVMLVNLAEDLSEGESISLTLVFDKAGMLTVEIPVQAR